MLPEALAKLSSWIPEWPEQITKHSLPILMVGAVSLRRLHFAKHSPTGNRCLAACVCDTLVQPFQLLKLHNI